MAAPRLAALLLLAARPARSWEAAHLRSELDRMMSNYGIMVRPGLAEGGTNAPEAVTVQIYVDRWQEMDDKKLTFGVDGYLRLWWFDQRLAFNASTTGATQLTLTDAQIKQIWLPDLYYEQLIDVKLGAQGGGRGAGFWVYPDGHVFYSRQASIRLACDMQKGFDSFPFDSHTCTIRLAFYSMSAAAATLSWKFDDTPGDVAALPNWDASGSRTACMAAWHVVSMDQIDEVQTWPSGSYTYAVADLKFTRRPTSYVLSYIVPAILLVSISCLGFWIDPAAVPARVTLGIVTILAVATNYISLHNTLAGAGGDSVWIFRFVFGSYLFNVLAFFELVMVNYGLQAEKWLHAQLERMRAEGEGWMAALERQTDSLEFLLNQWDVNGDGLISKQELRRGVAKLGVGAPAREINSFFNQISKSGDTATIPQVIHALHKAVNPDYAPPPADEKSDGILDKMSHFGSVVGGVVGGVRRRSSISGGPASSSGTCQPNVTLDVGTKEEETEDDDNDDGDAADAPPLHVQARLQRAVQPSPPPSPPSPSAASEGTALGEDSPSGRSSPSLSKRKSWRGGNAVGSGRLSTVTRRMHRHDSRHQLKVVQKRELRDARKQVRKHAAADAHAGYLWELKVFWLFPLLSKMRNLDHYARVVLPMTYFCYVLVFFSMNDWGRSLVSSDSTDYSADSLCSA